MNKRIVHDALILTAFTLVLGFILALVQGITAEPIDKANKAAAQKAYQACRNRNNRGKVRATRRSA